MNDDRLGITLELTEEAANSLRNRHASTSRRDTDDDISELLYPLQRLTGDPDDNWTEELKLPNTSTIVSKEADRQEVHIVEAEEGEEGDDGQSAQEDADDEEGEEEDEDDLSLTPPVSLPVVLVDLERLVGYQPTTLDEVQVLRTQVHAALWGQEDVVVPAASNPQEQQGDDQADEDAQLASRFDERAAELFASAIARHADTSELPAIMEDGDRSLHFVAMEYPEYLCQRAADPPTVANTARVWKRQLQPHSIQVVDRLLRHLSSCSRSLMWKDAMRSELVLLADSEEHARTRRVQSKELKKWKTERRKEQLEKLYTVRETFEHRIQVAAERLAELEKDRDETAAREIRLRRVQQGKAVGLEAFDFGSTVFAFPSGPEDFDILGMKKDDDREDDYPLGDGYTMSEHEDSDDEGYAPDAANTDDDADPDESDADDDPITFAARGEKSKRRRQAAARKRRHRLEAAAKEAEHKAKLEAAKAEEEYMREKCTSQELKMSATVVKSLEGRMTQVESLLESLQEEEWADEEEGIDALPADDTNLEATAQTNDAGLSILDQVLAMILGAKLPPPGSAVEIHVRMLQGEHQSIVSSWKDHFGRFPPTASEPGSGASRDTTDPFGQEANQAPVEDSEERTEALREALGIVDNETDDWADGDDDDDEEEVQAAAVSEQRNAPERSNRPVPKPGLRPGGRAS